MSQSIDERQIQKSIEKIAETLELTDIDQMHVGQDFSQYIKFFDTNPSALREIGFDCTMFLGSAGDWESALKICEKIIPLFSNNQKIKIWKLRCLYELEKNAELIAFVNSNTWKKECLVPVNYLAGRAYEKLGMHSQAQNKFNAVFQVNPKYQDIQQRFHGE